MDNHGWQGRASSSLSGFTLTAFKFVGGCSRSVNSVAGGKCAQADIARLHVNGSSFTP